MALEAVTFQPDPFIYSVKDHSCNNGGYDLGFQEEKRKAEHLDSNGDWDSPPASSAAQNTYSSPETCGYGSLAAGPTRHTLAPPPLGVGSRRKRRRTKNLKNKEEMENQRMTHIAVERNRRRQMNDYLAVLRSLMPPSYAQRGDQASIVGGAINYVKELEQLLQFLEAHKLTNQQQPPDASNANQFSSFFTFPQYSTSPTTTTTAVDTATERQSGRADIEVAMMESHANIKVSSKRRPKQLLKMVAGLQSICLTILHLNITTVGQSVLYSFSVKVEDECQLTTVNEIATAVHEIVGMTQDDSMSG